MPAHAAPFTPDPAAFAFFAKVSARLGGLDGFHPDTPFDDYVAFADDSRTFTDAEATALDAELSELMDRLTEEGFYAQVWAYAETHAPGSFMADIARNNRITSPRFIALEMVRLRPDWKAGEFCDDGSLLAEILAANKGLELLLRCDDGGERQVELFNSAYELADAMRTEESSR